MKRHLRIRLGLVVIACCGGWLTSGADAFAKENEALVESPSVTLANFVAQAASGLTASNITVLPFQHEDGSPSIEGQLLAERILTELSTNRNLRVVEREHLDKALAEQKLSLEGFVSPETAVKVGKLTGAKGVLTGTITELGDLLEIHARLFAVESGEVVAARKINSRRSVKTFINPLWDDMERIKTTGKPFNAKVWMDKARLPIGDEARLHFKVDHDCWV